MRQKYDELPLFPVRTFTFIAPEDLLDDTLEKCKKLQYKEYNPPGGVGTSDDIHINDDFKGIIDWFQECMDTLHADEGWYTDRVAVCKAWVNRSDKESSHCHDAHRHPMSLMSGIFYLTNTPYAPTIFLDPIDKREWDAFSVDGTRDEFHRQYVTPKRGGLIIFPSWLIHASMPNNSLDDRYTIAFNTFPMGDINKGGWDRPMVQIDNPLGPLDLGEYTIGQG